MTIAEYEVGLNNLIHFVPSVTSNDLEKAKRFHQGLNSEFWHVMGATALHNFRSVVKQARGMEMEMQLTKGLQPFGG
ncbi:hypothetical protein PSY31_23020, partial [Shigella flexneri]|nr:hypothetical protein [Shigella flexneri]